MRLSFGPYRLLRRLGEGGMAEVWSAQRSTLGGPVRCAVKIIRADRAGEAGVRELFLREGRLALALSGHANVVSVFDVGEHEGRLFLAMEEVDGVTLAELARRVDVPWPVEHAVHVVAALLRALTHIHGYAVGGESHGIVHRDVTPHNVMISSRGEVKLMDFGIALPADATPSVAEALGKLSYVPREQVEGEPDERSDLFAVGAILFELLDGRRFRWHCADEDAYFQEIYRERVPRLRRTDVPAPVLAVLEGLLQPDRERRIADAATALRGLEAWSGFRWAQSELEVLYRGVIGARHSGRTGLHEAVAEDGAPLPRASRSSSRDAEVPGRATPSGPRSPWSRARPGDEPSSAPRRAANDSGRRARARQRAEALAGLEADPLRALIEQPTEPRPSAEPPASQAAVTAAVPGCSGSVDEVPRVVDEHLPTRVQPEAEMPDLDGVVTRRHRATSDDLVSSREVSLDIAVTRAHPSKQAPWSPSTDPIARRLVRPEPGAPVKRHRRAHSGDLREESSGSVSPRARQSASLHRAAAGRMRTHEVTGEVVAGEIVEEDDLPGDPLWRVGSR